MLYRVKIDNTFSGVVFEFNNYEDAMNFIGMVIDAGYRETDEGVYKLSASIIKDEEVGL